MERATEAFTMMRSIGLKKGKNPLMWRITDFNDSQWIIYGRVAVGQSHDMRLHNLLNITLTEAV